MKIFLFLLCLLIIGSFSNVRAQDSLFFDGPDFSPLTPITCSDFSAGGVINFFSDSAIGSNYPASFSDTLTLCPDLINGSKLSAVFAIDLGMVWDIDASDTLFVYDGDNTSAPLLGGYNSATDPNGFSAIATFENNPTGCLTFVFKSDNLTEGAGWKANITCGSPPQPFNPKISVWLNGVGSPDTSLSGLWPRDTGYINLCPGDSVFLSASGDFPYNLETLGYGYSQTNTNCTYSWDFSDGTSASGQNVWFAPPAQAGYIATLRMTDPINYIKVIKAKIRVSTTPSFASALAEDDSLCVGQSTVLAGGITVSDTVGVSPTIGQFELGGSFAGLTYLPDGSGVNYSTGVPISGFGVNQAITASSDITKICITMEHSYLGDLEIAIVCPTGDTLILVNSYTGDGLAPGGFGGGTTFLGDAFDANLQTPGVGWEYCFSSDNATYGTMGTEFGAGTTIPTTISSGNAMDTSGIYLPEEVFIGLSGCIINGTWTLLIRDNIGTDDGYIFEWGIFFNSSINPDAELYTTEIVSAVWTSSDNTIIGTGDTIITVQPDTVGFSVYNYDIIDNFGCQHDTNITVFVFPQTEITSDTTMCDQLVKAVDVQWSLNGTWTYVPEIPGNTLSFNPSENVPSTVVTANDYGTYELTYYDSTCNNVDSVTIAFKQSPGAIPMTISGADFCKDTLGVLSATESVFIDSYDWQLTGSSATFPNAATIGVDSGGTYLVTGTGACGSTTQQVTIRRLVNIFGDTILCDTLLHAVSVESFGSGTWTYLGKEPALSATFSPNNTSENVIVTASTYGSFKLMFYDDYCKSTDTVYVDFKTVPTVNIEGQDFCSDIGETIVANESQNINTYFWQILGSTSIFPDSSSIKTFEGGMYEVMVDGYCGSDTDTLTLVAIDCMVDVPNVITPNGDGLNDNFVLDGVEKYGYPGIMIFNRWGNVVWESDQYQNDWKGTDQSGSLLPEGTYFYKLAPDNRLLCWNKIKCEGTITIIGTK